MYPNCLNISSHYYPFGMLMPGRFWPGNTVPAGGYRFGFNGMEKDDEVKGITGSSYDFGERSIYDPRVGRFNNPDPRTMEFPWYSPYLYAGNTPIQAIDLGGMQPESVLKFDNITGYYKLTEPAIHLMYLATGVRKDIIRETRIREKSTAISAPWFTTFSGGGAITVGKTVTFTSNWFANDQKEFGRYATKQQKIRENGQWVLKNIGDPISTSYGQDVYGWLKILSHEVEHRLQAEALYGTDLLGKALYLTEFAKQYTVAMSHDGALFEMWAETGMDKFNDFSNWVDKNVGKSSDDYLGTEIERLFRMNLSDEEKIQKLDTWYKAYREATSNNSSKSSTSSGSQGANVTSPNTK